MALIHLLERFHLHTLPSRVLPELNGTRISCSKSILLITIMQNPNLFCCKPLQSWQCEKKTDRILIISVRWNITSTFNNLQKSYLILDEFSHIIWSLWSPVYAKILIFPLFKIYTKNGKSVPFFSYPSIICILKSWKNV